MAWMWVPQQFGAGRRSVSTFVLLPEGPVPDEPCPPYCRPIMLVSATSSRQAGVEFALYACSVTQKGAAFFRLGKHHTSDPPCTNLARTTASCGGVSPGCRGWLQSRRLPRPARTRRLRPSRPWHPPARWWVQCTFATSPSAGCTGSPSRAGRCPLGTGHGRSARGSWGQQCGRRCLLCVRCGQIFAVLCDRLDVSLHVEQVAHALHLPIVLADDKLDVCDVGPVTPARRGHIHGLHHRTDRKGANSVVHVDVNTQKKGSKQAQTIRVSAAPHSCKIRPRPDEKNGFIRYPLSCLHEVDQIHAARNRVNRVERQGQQQLEKWRQTHLGDQRHNVLNHHLLHEPH